MTLSSSIKKPDRLEVINNSSPLFLRSGLFIEDLGETALLLITPIRKDLANALNQPANPGKVELPWRHLARID